MGSIVFGSFLSGVMVVISVTKLMYIVQMYFPTPTTPAKTPTLVLSFYLSIHLYFLVIFYASKLSKLFLANYPSLFQCSKNQPRWPPRRLCPPDSHLGLPTMHVFWFYVLFFSNFSGFQWIFGVFLFSC